MLERLIENWLTKVNERSFEIPFCQLLTSEGFQVVHLSRHGPAEQGKDILAIDPDGIPCAFQLKGSFGGKLTQKDWETILPQIQRLVELPIKHPSIDPMLRNKAFLVTTGEFDEEVRQEIVDRNTVWERKKYPRLETIVKGQLLQRFEKMHSNFWPLDLLNEKALLEFFLSDGRNYINKQKLSLFIDSLLHPVLKAKRRPEFLRILSGAAVINSYALSAYHLQDNHVAIMEGWTIFLATVLSYVERLNLASKHWQSIATICISAIESSTTNLLDELKQRKYLTEGDPFTDPLFYKGRATLLCALVAWHALWNRYMQTDKNLESWALEFIRKYEADFQFWGEAALPQFLAIYWFFLPEKTFLPERIPFNLLRLICLSNEKRNGLADPYHQFPEVISWGYDLPEMLFHEQEHFKGRSYSLEGLIHILAKKGWRGALEEWWKRITGIHFAEFIPKYSWQFYLWHSEEGRTNAKLPNAPESWAKLTHDASIIEKVNIPKLFQDNAILLLLFCIVYPHRFTKDVIKLIDEKIVDEIQ